MIKHFLTIEQGQKMECTSGHFMDDLLFVPLLRVLRRLMVNLLWKVKTKVAKSTAQK